MRSRGIRSRLDDITSRLPAARTLCALHGDLCQMGARWPLDGPEVEFYYLLRGARLTVGAPVAEPDPYTVNEHYPRSRQQQDEAAALLEQARAKVAADEAEIITGGDPA